MDDGERHETYRLAYIAFRKMNIVFSMAIIGLFVYGLFVSFNPLAFLLIGALWIIMNSIYYLEGYKSYK